MGKHRSTRSPFLLCSALAVLTGCSAPTEDSPAPAEPAPETATEESTATPETEVSETVTMEGHAANAKLGAMLRTEGGSLYIDGLDSWPEALNNRDVRVTGRIITRDDLPLVVNEPGGEMKAGVPVEPGMGDAARSRKLITDAKWELIEPSP